jgi:hypothetical protein
MARQLNNTQINNLKTILKFRYVTTNNLALYQNITHNSAYSALEILHKTDYLGKLHDKSYRLQNKSARYYLTLQAINYLRTELSLPLDDAIWKSRKGDNNKSNDFIDQQVAIHTAYNALQARLGENATIMTALEMYGTEGIIKPLPGILVSPKSDRHFFVELTDGQHLFLAKKRIRKYIDNYESNEWEWDTYPNVYIVRSSPADRSRLKKYVEEQMDDNYLDADDFSFYIVSKAEQIKPN